MNDKMVKEFKHNMTAMTQLMEVNAAALEKLITRQSALVKEVLEANVAHAKNLVDCKDMTAMVEFNKAWGRELSEKLMAAGKANAEAMEAARGEAADVVEGMVKSAQSQIEAGVAELRSRMEATVEQAQAQVEDAVKQVERASKTTKQAA